MASGNDPTNIPYIIAENGFYYVAYKEKAKVPEIVVSSKGVANGLSEEYNDGWDFGPDSYDPTSTANPPYTETVGLQDAFNYLKVQNRKIVIQAGYYDIGNNTLTIPNIPNATIEIEGEVPAAQDAQSSSLPNNTVGVLIYSTSVNTNNTTSAGVITVSSSGYSTSEFNEVHIKNIGIITVYNSTNGSAQNTAFNLFNANKCKIDSCVAITTAAEGTVTSYPSLPGVVGNVVGFAMNGSQGYAIAENCYVNNYYAGFFVSAHTTLIGCAVGNCSVGLSPFGLAYYDHPIQLVNFDVEVYYTAIAVPSGTGITYGIYGTLTLEWTSFTNYLIEDIDNALYGEIYVLGHLNGNTDLDVTQNITCNGAQNVRIRVPTALYPTPTLSANPPVSGTVYQNTNNFDIEIDLPVYATTAGTAGYVTVAKGASSSSLTTIGNQYVSGDTSDTSEQIIRLRVPAGWYYEFTASGVTFGTASVFAD